MCVLYLLVCTYEYELYLRVESECLFEGEPYDSI